MDSLLGGRSCEPHAFGAHMDRSRDWWHTPAAAALVRRRPVSHLDAGREHILFQGVDVWKSGTEPDPDWWVTVHEGKDEGTAARTERGTP